MGIAIAHNPPPDNAGGYFVVRYRLADVLTHLQKVHVVTFDPASGAYNPATGQPTPTEATVDDTINNYLPFVHPMFDAAWDIGITSLFRISRTAVTLPSGIVIPIGQPYRVPLFRYHQHAGSGTTATDGIQGVTQTILNFNTVGNSRGRLRYVGVGGVVPTIDEYTIGNTAGTDLEKIVAYVTSAASGVIGHDGTKLLDPSHTTYDLVKRDRAKGMRVA